MLINIIQESAMPVEDKRFSVMIFLHYALVTFRQKGLKNKNIVFKEIQKFLAEPED